MRNTLYWSLLILGGILLAYVSPFGLYHLVFLAGAGALALTYFALFPRNQRRFGVISVFLYVAVYWTTVGVFSNVKEQREFQARYEPYVHEGIAEGYTFFYLDYPESYERINSEELNKLLAEKKPERVRMVLETVKDFGRLRAYTVRSVESIPVAKEWTSGNPPWQELRKP